MQTNLPLPVDRVIAPPNTDKIEKEDRDAEEKVDEARKAPPKEPFDTHLHRVMPPGWSPTSDLEAAASEVPLFAAGAFKPGWLMKALGDLEAPPPAPGSSTPLLLHVITPAPFLDAHQILEAVKQGVPIHEAHFPSLFVAQVSQMQNQGQPITQLAVQIAPEHLGQLQLKFVLQQQTVTVSVLVANQQAKESMDRQLSAIHAILCAHQLKPAEIKVEVAQPGQGSQQNFNGQDEGYHAPNRWLLKRGDLDEELDVSV